MTNNIADWTNSQIMTKAWEIARQAAAHHKTGRSCEYFARCLKAVWAKVKAARAQRDAMIIGSKEWHRRVAACIDAERAA